ncbi:MAG: redox-sensing transcriptional repressor Rex [Sphaerochaetaceae bacterium]
MISIPTIKRFPSYLRLLRQYKEEGEQWVSATRLAEELGLTPIQVRKDMAGTGVEGKPKVGFEIESLISAIICNLGWDTPTDAILIGAGHLGGALARYEGFATYGLHIVAVFDADPAKVAKTIGNKVIKPMEAIEAFIKKNAISIAVVAVPADVAQEVADLLVEAGIKAIWNFAPKDLRLPPDVVVERTDLATSFAVLSAKYRRIFGSGEECVESRRDS